MDLLVVGDSHCNITFMEKVIATAAELGITTILSLGDYGYWPRHKGGRYFLERQNKLLVEHGITLYWIDGNHEDHDRLDKLKRQGQWTDDGFLKVFTNILYIPRAHTWTWGTKTCMAMGGAYSIDKYARVAGNDWFPQEMITNDDVAAASRRGKVDILFCHDVPDCVDIAHHCTTAWGGRGFHKIAESAYNQHLLNEVVRACQPNLIVHGHMHLRYTDRIELDGRTIEVEGLSHDGAPEGALIVLEL